MKKFIYGATALAAITLTGIMIAQDAVETKAYQYVITDKEGNSTIFPADQVENIRFEEAPEYTPLPVNYLLGYEEKDGSGEYHLELASDECDAYGEPLDVGAMLISVTLRAPKSEDMTNPVLPEGYYRIGNGTEDYTFNVNSSALWVRWEEGEDGVNPSIILDGTIDVRATGDDTYDIRFELTTMDGTIDLRYEGALDFPAGYSDFEAFTEDVNVTFENADGRFYGSWSFPFSADLSTRFWAGTIEDGDMKEGYILNVDFNEPKPADCMAAVQRVADGTYTVEPREEIPYYSYLPYRYNGGKWIELWGQKYLVNTYITYLDAKGHRKLGLITGGTFTVSDNGTKFSFDFVTEDGFSVKGSYNKAPNITNYCDNDVKEPSRPYSTLKEDLALNFPSDVVAASYNNGKIIIEDANLFTLFVTDSKFGTTGDYLQIDLLCESDVLADGTYEVKNQPEINSALYGCIDYGGEPFFSWYSNLDEEDEEGYLLKLAPINGGKVTISTNNDGTRKIVFAFTDDAGNAITGEYEGKLYDLSASDSDSNQMAKKLSPRKSGLKNNAKVNRLQLRGKK